MTAKKIRTNTIGPEFRPFYDPACCLSKKQRRFHREYGNRFLGLNEKNIELYRNEIKKNG